MSTIPALPTAVLCVTLCDYGHGFRLWCHLLTAIFVLIVRGIVGLGNYDYGLVSCYGYESQKVVKYRGFISCPPNKSFIIELG